MAKRDVVAETETAVVQRDNLTDTEVCLTVFSPAHLALVIIAGSYSTSESRGLDLAVHGCVSSYHTRRSHRCSPNRGPVCGRFVSPSYQAEAWLASVPNNRLVSGFCYAMQMSLCLFFDREAPSSRLSYADSIQAPLQLNG